AEAHFPGKVLGGEIIEGVRKRLGRTRDFLEENYPELPICLVSETYYVRFRDTPPTTAANARKCLPVGYGKGQEGIRLQSGEDDLIWKEAISLNLAQGAGKMKKSGDRTVRALEGHRLSEAEATRLLTEPQKTYQLERPEIAAQLLEALPEGDDDDTP
ncbi:MAG: hypothetical protein WD805_04800, partial [Gaiellaceae bacterium]